MTSNLKLNKFITLLNENYDPLAIKIYQDEMISVGLGREDIDVIMSFLIKKKVILHKQVKFAPNKTMPTFPKHADYSSSENNEYSVPVYFLKIDKRRLKRVINSFLKSRFIVKSAKLIIGNEEIRIPPFKNEYYLCKVMFKRGIAEPTDWGTVYEEMTGLDEYKKNKWHVVYDAMEAINQRVKKYSDSPLFLWREKTIQRLY